MAFGRTPPGERFEIEPEESYREPKQGFGCLKGCLLVMALMAALLLVFGMIAASQWRGWAVSLATTAIDQSLDASNLPPQEKIEVREELQRLLQGFQQDQVSGQQMVEIMNTLVQSPLMNSFVVSVVEAQYLNKSGLDAEEIATGKTTLRRFVSGMFDQKIDDPSIDKVLSHIADQQADGTWRFRPQVSDDDLRAMLATAKSIADEENIPADVEVVDPSDEVRRIIDKALGQAAVPE